MYEESKDERTCFTSAEHFIGALFKTFLNKISIKLKLLKNYLRSNL